MGIAGYVETCFMTLEGVLEVFDIAVRQGTAKVKGKAARRKAPNNAGLLGRFLGCAGEKSTAVAQSSPGTVGSEDGEDGPFAKAVHAWFGPADPVLAAAQKKQEKRGTIMGVNVEALGFLRRQELQLAPEGMSTGDVCGRIVVPAAGAKHIEGPLLRYFYGLRDTSGAPLVGPITYFASHAWRYQHVDLVRTLRDHTSLTYNRTRQLPYYWVDLVSKDQLNPQPSTAEFKNAIKQAAHVVAVLDTLDAPVALTYVVAPIACASPSYPQPVVLTAPHLSPNVDASGASLSTCTPSSLGPGSKFFCRRRS